jgi:O-antigen ligase
MKENSWLIVLIVFMLVSVLWSSIPKTSFFRWAKDLQALILSFAVLSEPSPRQAMESILRRTTYILIPFSILLIKYFPEYGIVYSRWTGERGWIGVGQQKNSLSLLCIIAAFFLIWSLMRRWRAKVKPVWKYETHLEIFILVLALWLMRGPSGNFFYSATSFYALCAGLLAYLGLNLTKKLRRTLRASTIMIIVALIIILGIVVLFTGGSNIKYFASAAGRDDTLTGRTEVWASLLPFAMRRPLLGNGFGSFWTPITRDFFQISGAHSGYLDVLLGLGFVGFLLISIFLMASCRKAHRELSSDFDWGILWICYIVMTVVHNITESSIDTFSSFMSAVLLFFMVSSTDMVSYRQQ